MRISHNIGALNTYRQLTINGTNTNKSLEKLSSGLRINRAGDDAAGLAISEKMRGQIRGLDRAAANAQDGISLIQTAEGALNETHSILQRMRELAVQASNDTNTIDDRNEIQKEIDQLTSEINRISSDTEFNTKKLLNGNMGITSEITTAGNTNINSVEVVDAGIQSGQYTVAVTVTGAFAVDDVLDGGSGVQAADVTIATASAAAPGTYRAEILEDKDNAGKYVVEIYDTRTGSSIGSQNNLAIGTDTAIISGVSVDLANVSQAGNFTFSVEADFSMAVLDSAGNTVGSTTLTDYDKSSIELAGLKMNFDADLTSGVGATATTVTVLSNAVQYHIGSNEGQTLKMAVSDMSATALGVDDLDVTSAAGAEVAITAISDAIKTVSAERSKLGAYQNRLEHTINNLGTSAENLTASESRIRDVDMAKEMMEFTKNNILSQAAQAMLAQANQQPQGVLQLLQ